MNYDDQNHRFRRSRVDVVQYDVIRESNRDDLTSYEFNTDETDSVLLRLIAGQLFLLAISDDGTTDTDIGMICYKAIIPGHEKALLHIVPLTEVIPIKVNEMLIQKPYLLRDGDAIQIVDWLIFVYFINKPEWI